MIRPESILAIATLVSTILVVLLNVRLFLRIPKGFSSFILQRVLDLPRLLPERKSIWGTVYDSQTKRPIPFVKVQLLDHHQRVLETRVADKDGRYGFLTSPSSLAAQHMGIFILPTHKKYFFPSKIRDHLDMFIYNSRYYGEMVTVSAENIINFDIPMDPESSLTLPGTAIAPSIALGIGVAALADIGFWLGLVTVPLHFILNPNPFTFGTMCLFLGVASLRIFGISEHPYGTVIDVQTGRAMPFALITLSNQDGERVAFTVSDERGRYVLLGKSKHFRLDVATPSAVTPPRRSSLVLSSKRGWITEVLHV